MLQSSSQTPSTRQLILAMVVLEPEDLVHVRDALVLHMRGNATRQEEAKRDLCRILKRDEVDMEAAVLAWYVLTGLRL